MAFLRSWGAVSLFGSLTAFVSFFLVPLGPVSTGSVSGWAGLTQGISDLLHPPSTHGLGYGLLYLLGSALLLGLLFFATVNLVLCIGSIVGRISTYLIVLQHLCAALGIIPVLFFLVFGGNWGDWVILGGFLASFANPQFGATNRLRTPT